MKNVLVIISVLLLSCINKNGKASYCDEEINDTIFVTYAPYLFESSVMTSCRELAEDAKCDSVQLVVKEISLVDYDLIADFIKNVDYNGEDSACEARVHIKMGDRELCISDFICCACNLDDKGIDTSNDEYAIYKLKQLSGYYNCFDSLDIQYDELIQKYGIPKDYRYENKKVLTKGGPDSFDDLDEFELNFEEIRRVAIVVNSTRTHKKT